MRTKGSKNKGLTAEEYKELFEKYKGDVLFENEEARQMVKHKPYLFITDKGRVLSVKKDRIRVRKQTQRVQKYSNDTKGSNERKHCVCILIDGKPKVYYTHLLVAEYFSDKISSFVTGDEDKTIIHHIKGYDPTSDSNNNVNNLIRMNPRTHLLMHSMGVKSTEEERQKWRERIYRVIGDKHCMFYKSPDGQYSGVLPLTDKEFELLSNSEEYKNKFLENHLEKKGII